MSGGVFSTAKLHAMTIRESADDGSDFTNPDADYRRLFLGEDGALHLKDSAGTVTDVNSATARIGARVSRSTAQTIANATLTEASFDTEERDDGGIWAIGSPTQLVAPADDWYHVLGGVQWASSSTGIRNIYIYVNGTFVPPGEEDAASGPTAVRQQISAALYLDAGDIVTIRLNHTAGGNLDTVAGRLIGSLVRMGRG